MKQWDYRFGGIDEDDISSLLQTTDGGFILGGSTYSGIGGNKTQPSWGESDYWIVKTDSLGNYQWDRRYGGTLGEIMYSMKQTTDGGYILGGVSESDVSGDKTQPAWDLNWDYWIVKTDSLGNYQWDKRFGGTDPDFLYSLQQTTDGGYILGGYSESGISGDKTQSSWGGAADYWIVKTDSLGNYQWDKSFGGTVTDELTSLQQTTDGGYILAGWSNSGIGGDKTQPSWGYQDYWIVKIDSAGNYQWDKRFGGTDNDEPNSIHQTEDKGYIIGGFSTSDSSGDKSQPSWGAEDYWIVKTDSLGNKQWDKDFGGIYNEDEFGNVSQTTDHGYLIVGASYSNISGDKTENNLGLEQTWLVKTNSFGIKQWDKTIFTNGPDESGIAIQTKDGCYAITNYSNSGIGGYKTQANWGVTDYWLIKFCDTASALPFISSDNKICEKFCTNFFDQSNNNPTGWHWIFPGGDPASSSEQNPVNVCYSNPGLYDVMLITTSATGNDTLTLSNYITVYPTPPFPVITQNGYVLTSSAATSYQWQFNAVDIPGATNQLYTAMQTGLYAVIVDDSNGCENSATRYVLISAVSEVNDNMNIFISPNPSDGNFVVKWLNAQMANELSITIMNTLGQEIYASGEKNVTENFTKAIDLSSLAQGIYFLEIKSGEKLFRKKMVIAR